MSKVIGLQHVLIAKHPLVEHFTHWQVQLCNTHTVAVNQLIIRTIITHRCTQCDLCVTMTLLTSIIVPTVGTLVPICSCCTLTFMQCLFSSLLFNRLIFQSSELVQMGLPEVSLGRTEINYFCQHYVFAFVGLSASRITQKVLDKF